MKKIAAIILNYYSSDDCKKCIEYLKMQSFPKLEIIVVDNASINGEERSKLIEICSLYNVNLILHDSNDGFSSGNNIGLREAVKKGADWCLIINPDVELRDSNFISYISNEIKKWPDVVVIGSNVLLPDGKNQNPQRESTFWEDFLWPVQAMKAKINKNFKWYLCEQKTGYCEKVTGACFFIETEFLKNINYLDENIFMYCEEAILSKQVKKYGKKELYINEVTAWHEHYSNKKSSNYKRMLIFLESRKYFINNYSDYNYMNKKILNLSLDIQKIYWKLKG